MCCKSELYVSDIVGADCVVFQREFRDGMFKKMLETKELGCKVIYDTDDDVLNMPRGFPEPFKHYMKPEVREMIKKFYRNVDAITVSTKYLGEAIEEFADNVPIYVVENSLDVEMWEEAYKKKEEKETVTIGWMASGSHKIDAPLISATLKNLMLKHDNLNLHFIGWISPDEYEWVHQFGNRIKVEKWVLPYELPFHMIDFDIGIAPLYDNKFNRSKSAIKAFQYQTSRIPCVASPLNMYKDVIESGVNGYLPECADTWYDCLDELIRGDTYRKKMGSMGRELLLEKYDTRKRYQDWIKLFNMVGG